MKKLIGFLAGSLVALLAIGALADDLWKEIIVTVATNAAVSESITVDEEGYVSSALFNFPTSGTYSVSMDIVKGTVTNRVVSETIAAGTTGLWLPEGRLWIATGNTILITCAQCSASTTNTTNIQIAR